MIHSTRLKTWVGSALVAGLLFAGCGGDDEGDGGGGSDAAADAGGSTLALAADPSGKLVYDKDSLTASAGKVTIDLTNDASVPHDVVIEQGGKKIAATDQITGGKTSTSAELEPGTYTFYCSVPGHREGGMDGRLAVK